MDSSLPVEVRGQFLSVMRLRMWTVRDCGLSADSACSGRMPVCECVEALRVRGCGLFARLLAWTEHGHGLFVDTDGLSPRPVLGLSAYVELPRLRP